MSWGRLFADLLAARWSIADIAKGYGLSPEEVRARINAYHADRPTPEAA